MKSVQATGRVGLTERLEKSEPPNKTTQSTGTTESVDAVIMQGPGLEMLTACGHYAHLAGIAGAIWVTGRASRCMWTSLSLKATRFRPEMAVCVHGTFSLKLLQLLMSSAQVAARFAESEKSEKRPKALNSRCRELL